MVQRGDQARLRHNLEQTVYEAIAESGSEALRTATPVLRSSGTLSTEEDLPPFPYLVLSLCPGQTS